MDIKPFTYASPTSWKEIVSFANANAYEWAYLDTMREAGCQPKTIPDGWPFAWLEYVRRNPNRMAIREAFRYWRDHATLPGLS